MYCVSPTSAFRRSCLWVTKEGDVVEGVSEAVVEGNTQIYVLAHV